MLGLILRVGLIIGETRYYYAASAFIHGYFLLSNFRHQKHAW